jgi:hypothetical protein
MSINEQNSIEQANNLIYFVGEEEGEEGELILPSKASERFKFTTKILNPLIITGILFLLLNGFINNSRFFKLF